MVFLLSGCGDGVARPEIIKTQSGVEMVRIPAGTFQMGCNTGKEDERPVHAVTLDSFYMDRTEVTQAQFAALNVSNLSHFRAPENPAEMVKWLQAAEFCNKRSTAEGLTPCYQEDGTCNFDADGYRLPTEAEWEYACRAGTSTAYSAGDDPRAISDYAWYADNSGKKTHPAGQKHENPWGLCDMHGNVGEWCNDVYEKDYYQTSPAKNPRGPAEKPNSKYVVRGGSWNLSADGLRSTSRSGENPGFADACLAIDATGFGACERRLRRVSKY